MSKFNFNDIKKGMARARALAAELDGLKPNMEWGDLGAFLAEHPDNADLWYRKAIEFQLSDDENEYPSLEHMQTMLEVATELSGDNPEYIAEVGHYLRVMMDKPESSLSHYQKARELLIKQWEDLTVGYAYALIELEQEERAREVIREGRLLAPESEDLQYLVETFLDGTA